MKTPEDNFRMPAEWEPHEATWLSWPHNSETWPGKMDRIAHVWAEIIAALLPGEKVHLTVNDFNMEEEVRRFLIKKKIFLQNLIFHHIPTNDCWIRDSGPIFVVNDSLSPGLVITDWDFNTWGGKYPPWDLDNQVPEKISNSLGLPSIKTEMVLEGGSIDANGQGSLLTTEACLLNKNRNPGLTKAEIEENLKAWLGVQNILWLGEGIVGDDTDGHVDDMTRFVGSDTIVTMVEEDPADINYKILQDNLARLKKMKDQNGKDLKIATLPMPNPMTHEGQRLPASYANFYIGNKVVLVPTFSCPQDEKALTALAGFFPSRKIIGIDATNLICGLGAFHCVTQQQPAIS